MLIDIDKMLNLSDYIWCSTIPVAVLFNPTVRTSDLADLFPFLLSIIIISSAFMWKITIKIQRCIYFY